MRVTDASMMAGAMALALAATSPAAAQLAGSEWAPVTIGDMEIPAGTDIFVQFRGGGRIRGDGGCNQFSGTYELSGDEIEIGPLVATRKACTDNIVEREHRFMEALEAAKRFVRVRYDLSLTDAGGNLVARLRQTDAD